MDDAALLIACDALLSLIRHRESSGLSEQTIRDLDELLRSLRPRTNQIARPGPCPDPDCDGDAGHAGRHYQWVPE